MTAPSVLSVSQVEKFDSEQLGGCPRRWWFEDVRGLRPESTGAHEDGHQGHALLARYLTAGERPGRVRLGKVVNAVIDSGRLPRPGPHLQVEQRFSGQPQRDAGDAWVPLDVSRTLWHAGHPWEGFIDLRFRHRDGTTTVWDHKFSSDIHARALPAEKLIRTVQMPVYALDTLRAWPDTTGFNLVHLYVSRRGVESFIRHQRVNAEQIHERAEEVAGLVRQMDAVRAITAQDDVPFNRAACHARTGCPHQFRCNAFRRKSTMMDLNDEEKAMFGLLSDKKPAGPKDWDTRPFDGWPLNGLMCSVCGKPQRATGGGPCCESGHGGADGVKPVPARVTEPLPDAPAGRVTATADLNLDDIFEAPKPSTPKSQPAPTCAACGEVLTPENSSRLKTGDMKHIGCAKGGISLVGGGALVVDALPTAATAQRCPDCPHLTHAGKRCEGKRGKGQCRCGEAVSHTPAFEVGVQPQRPAIPPAPKFKPGAEEPNDLYDRVELSGKLKQSAAELQAQADEAARAADVDGDGAAVAEAQELQRAGEEAREREERATTAYTLPEARAEVEHLTGLVTNYADGEARMAARVAELEDQLRTAREIIDDPGLAPRGPWSGTLAVNVTVELGPSTLAFLAGLVKR